MVSSQRVSMPTTGNCRSLLALVALVGLREADCAAVRKTCREARQNLHNVHAVVNDHTWCYQIPTQVCNQFYVPYRNSHTAGLIVCHLVISITGDRACHAEQHIEDCEPPADYYNHRFHPCKYYWELDRAFAGGVGVADASRFIRVNGYDLEVDDAKSFRYVGCNLPMLLQDAAREAPDAQGTYPTVDALLDDVVRTWAFNDGDSITVPLQYDGEHFDETVFRVLDYIVHAAGRRGLRLILPLMNYGSSGGGVAQYHKWAAHRAGSRITADYAALWSSDEGSECPLFYSDPASQEMYRYMAHKASPIFRPPHPHPMCNVLTRVNTYTRTAYNNDPTIMLWELGNGLRCPGKRFGGKPLQRWYRQMAPFVRRLAPKQLLGSGSEGFFLCAAASQERSSRGCQAGEAWRTTLGIEDIANWMDAQGVDYIGESAIPEFDARLDAWPPTMLSRLGGALTRDEQRDFLDAWILAHEAGSTRKAILLNAFAAAECDWYNDPEGCKQKRLSGVLSTVQNRILPDTAAGGKSVAAVLWSPAADGGPIAHPYQTYAHKAFEEEIAAYAEQLDSTPLIHHGWHEIERQECNALADHLNKAFRVEETDSEHRGCNNWPDIVEFNLAPLPSLV
ncbi:1,4-beta-D-mannan endohydrolase [Emiliania huxleyi CCMP1516]|uniref:mannan endo-1,4-beta-mannosidase n=2 Tax=Emiliania huxleyi TaxID=2903 RepID=A0A0D3KN18_EMIH1|nr:1,4-beta-D-mannan endohydrolase [Emiliania huxleyi CCMP1516]EOD37153.1 1,4-beta-D-mannan endohydrolase [Emiliania huxleyi CCMP1516]|eukprot:XP_005789582.1 1,4-beta-D-mannan endohydrolase [Emiliania huxleyi CCMP1516]